VGVLALVERETLGRTVSSLPQKLEAVDRHSEKTRAFLHAFIDQYWDEIGVLAKGRLVTGHFVFGDRNFKEWGPERLLKENIEELADARNYLTERFVKLDRLG
jgi:hypothetical protein